MSVAEMDTAAQLQEYLTDAKVKSPDCGEPMLGARICDPSASLSSFIGLVCCPCNMDYYLGDDSNG
jgi:hypothetical protein